MLLKNSLVIYCVYVGNVIELHFETINPILMSICENVHFISVTDYVNVGYMQGCSHVFERGGA